MFARVERRIRPFLQREVWTPTGAAFLQDAETVMLAFAKVRHDIYATLSTLVVT